MKIINLSSYAIDKSTKFFRLNRVSASNSSKHHQWSKAMEETATAMFCASCKVLTLPVKNITIKHSCTWKVPVLMPETVKPASNVFFTCFPVFRGGHSTETGLMFLT